jgi:hypothetical protein
MINNQNSDWKYKTNKKNQNKTSIAKAMGSFRDSQVPSWLSGPQTDVPAEPPVIGPARNPNPIKTRTVSICL